MALTVETSRSIPRSADAVGFAVATAGAVSRQLGLSRAALTAHGFDGTTRYLNIANNAKYLAALTKNQLSETA